MEVWLTGQVVELYKDYVVMEQADGPAAIVPRWMAGAVQRDWVGAYLALLSDRLDPASAVVEALPAIDIQYPSETIDIRYSLGTSNFSPYGRSDARARSITTEDARLLAGEPQQLRILVPVTIDG
jgi:hypothetical protein